MGGRALLLLRVVAAVSRGGDRDRNAVLRLARGAAFTIQWMADISREGVRCSPFRERMSGRIGDHRIYQAIVARGGGVPQTQQSGAGVRADAAGRNKSAMT